MARFPKIRPVLAKAKPAKAVTVKDLGNSLKTFGRALEKGNFKGRIQMRSLDAGHVSSFCLEIDRGKSRLLSRPVKYPEVEIIAKKEVLVEIGNGTVSPVDAFLTGRLEFRGDLNLAKRILVLGSRGSRDTSLDLLD